MINKKKNNFFSLLKLVDEFNKWKDKNNIGNVFFEMENRYNKIITQQNKIIEELRKLIPL